MKGFNQKAYKILLPYIFSTTAILLLNLKANLTLWYPLRCSRYALSVANFFLRPLNSLLALQHVGPLHYDHFFKIVDTCLKPDVSTAVVTSTTRPESRFTKFQCVIHILDGQNPDPAA